MTKPRADNRKFCLEARCYVRVPPGVGYCPIHEAERARARAEVGFLRKRGKTWEANLSPRKPTD